MDLYFSQSESIETIPALDVFEEFLVAGVLVVANGSLVDTEAGLPQFQSDTAWRLRFTSARYD